MIDHTILCFTSRQASQTINSLRTGGGAPKNCLLGFSKKRIIGTHNQARHTSKVSGLVVGFCYTFLGIWGIYASGETVIFLCDFRFTLGARWRACNYL